MFKRILLCFDGSKSSAYAARIAIELAASQRAALEVISVVEIPDYAGRVGKVDLQLEQSQLYYMAGQQGLIRQAAELGVMLDGRIMMGNAARTIVRCAAESKADLIVLGDWGHSSSWNSEFERTSAPDRSAAGQTRGGLGSVADQVAEHARCPVLIAR